MSTTFSPIRGTCRRSEFYWFLTDSHSKNYGTHLNDDCICIYVGLSYSKLQIYSSHHRGATYILKPSAGCRGTGIYLERFLKNINQAEKMICQVYIARVNLKKSFSKPNLTFLEIFVEF